jgi:hypothetical protein
VLRKEWKLCIKILCGEIEALPGPDMIVPAVVCSIM